jgi:hypothetical protein
MIVQRKRKTYLFPEITALYSAVSYLDRFLMPSKPVTIRVEQARIQTQWWRGNPATEIFALPKGQVRYYDASGDLAGVEKSGSLQAYNNLPPQNTLVYAWPEELINRLVSHGAALVYPDETTSPFCLKADDGIDLLFPLVLTSKELDICGYLPLQDARLYIYAVMYNSGVYAKTSHLEYANMSGWEYLRQGGVV